MDNKVKIACEVIKIINMNRMGRIAKSRIENRFLQMKRHKLSRCISPNNIQAISFPVNIRSQKIQEVRERSGIFEIRTQERWENKSTNFPINSMIGM